MIEWHEAFKQLDIGFSFKTNNPELWNSTYAELAFRPVNYLASSLDYQLAYQRGHGGDWQDISCVLCANGKTIGLWPLTLSKRNGIPMLSSQGMPVMQPVFVEGCQASVRKKYSVACLGVAQRLAGMLDISNWQSESAFVGFHDVSDWQLAVMDAGGRCSVRHDLYVDLSLELSEIKARFRRSFRSLINSGQRHWQVHILRAPGNASEWEEFRRLHLEVSGRVTRSPESWQIQHAMLAADEGFLVVLRDSSGRMVGAGYFMCSADEGVYAVGAYDRSLFDKPLGHVVQYRAIEELQRRGCRWYRIGARCFPGDDVKPSAKEISISNFKEGFASHVLPGFVLTMGIT